MKTTVILEGSQVAQAVDSYLKSAGWVAEYIRFTVNEIGQFRCEAGVVRIEEPHEPKEPN
jgi:hypothetical protein